MNPLRRLLDAHPPWAHWSFFAVWVIAASIGPIAIFDGRIVGSGLLPVGFAIYGVALVTMAIDWLVVRRRRARDPRWTAWQPPRHPREIRFGAGERSTEPGRRQR